MRVKSTYYHILRFLITIAILFLVGILFDKIVESGATPSILKNLLLAIFISIVLEFAPREERVVLYLKPEHLHEVRKLVLKRGFRLESESDDSIRYIRRKGIMRLQKAEIEISGKYFTLTLPGRMKIESLEDLRAI